MADGVVEIRNLTLRCPGLGKDEAALFARAVMEQTAMTPGLYQRSGKVGSLVVRVEQTFAGEWRASAGKVSRAIAGKLR